jgi:hypothetical protein
MKQEEKSLPVYGDKDYPQATSTYDGKSKHLIGVESPSQDQSVGLEKEEVNWQERYIELAFEHEHLQRQLKSLPSNALREALEDFIKWSEQDLNSDYLKLHNVVAKAKDLLSSSVSTGKEGEINNQK